MSSKGSQPPRHAFGQTMYRKKNGYESRNTNTSNYQLQFGGNKSKNTVYRPGDSSTAEDLIDDRTTTASNRDGYQERLKNQYRARKNEMTQQVELSFGLQQFVYEENQSNVTTTKRGWLYNMIQTTVRCHLAHFVALTVAVQNLSHPSFLPCLSFLFYSKLGYCIG
jgi:hypothetical protein